MFESSYSVTDNSTEGIKRSILYHLKYTLAQNPRIAPKRDWWLATCYTVRDRILEKFERTQEAHNKSNVRRVYYLSLEYLVGRLLVNNLYNTGLFEGIHQALREIGQNLDTIIEEEVDMGLGNGGLGRLAACFLDSLATLDYPAAGYGIHYEFGLFVQKFVHGRQVENPDNWLQFGNPWQIMRPEYTQSIPLYGRVVHGLDAQGNACSNWIETKTVLGIPWDIPIVGYNNTSVNFLRLWESRASQELDFEVFNEGGYIDAVREKAMSETISKVLYPNDQKERGKELRLVQQYFFVACSLRDIIRRFLRRNRNWADFPAKVVIQLNDTHPAIAVIELMRLFIDDHKLDWNYAWSLCQKIFAYTNHTLLPEALEKWSVPLLEKVLPRHLEIVYKINHHFLEDVVAKRWPEDWSKKAQLSIVEEGPTKMIRMAYLATIASFSINGVAKLHTQLLKKNLFSDFFSLYPHRFNNKTNGITPRRWLKACNPRLVRLIEQYIGEGWVTDLDQLKQLEPLADNKAFQESFMAVKSYNKEKLTHVIQKICEISVDPQSLFDVQIKRLHEYKRQHLNLLHILTLYHRLLENPDCDLYPRVFIFGAKAAPGYTLAKTIIYAINAVAKRINHDLRIRDKIKVVFLPNYNVSLAEQIIPTADISEQISTAGKEASGTSNMKFALNGACTLGTLDGANIEMLEEIGKENMFIFGLTVDEVEQLQRKGYNPFDYYHRNSELKYVLDWLCSDYFSPEEPYAFHPIRKSLLEGGDPFFVLADYEAYCKAQASIDQVYRNKSSWAKMAILNMARIGKFSSDRTIHEYAQDIWKLDRVKID